MLLELTDSNFTETVLKSAKLTIVDFWAEWCGPCRALGPVFEDLSKEYAGKVNVGKLNVDNNPEVSMHYGITSIPSILYFRKEKVCDKLVGAQPKSNFVRKIEKHLTKEDEEKAENVDLMGIVNIQGKMCLVSFMPDGTYRFLDERGGSHNIFYPYQFCSTSFRAAIEEFEYLINDNKAKESDLQNFFERYPDFILNDDYKSAHSKIILEREDEGNLIPDFVLEPLNSKGLSDLLDIKLPQSKVFTLKKNRERFSSAVFEACAQLREYSHFFDEKINREKVQNRYGLRIYKPRMLVIIGRRGPLNSDIIRAIESDIPNLTLKTYDDILERAKHRFRY